MAGGRQFIRVICANHHSIYLALPAPSVGALQFCTSCDDYTEVIEIPDYWSAICRRRGCFTAIQLREDVVMKQATRHAKGKRHVVVIRHQETVIREWSLDMERWEDRLSIAEMRRLKEVADGAN